MLLAMGLALGLHTRTGLAHHHSARGIVAMLRCVDICRLEQILRQYQSTFTLWNGIHWAQSEFVEPANAQL